MLNIYLAVLFLRGCSIFLENVVITLIDLYLKLFLFIQFSTCIEVQESLWMMTQIPQSYVYNGAGRLPFQGLNQSFILFCGLIYISNVILIRSENHLFELLTLWESIHVEVTAYQSQALFAYLRFHKLC